MERRLEVAEQERQREKVRYVRDKVQPIVEDPGVGTDKIRPK